MTEPRNARSKAKNQRHQLQGKVKRSVQEARRRTGQRYMEPHQQMRRMTTRLPLMTKLKNLIAMLRTR